MNRIIPQFLSAMIVALVISVGIGCGGAGIYLGDELKHPIAGDWDKSVHYFQEIMEQQPDNKAAALGLSRAKMEASLAHMNKGEKLMRQKMFTEAIAEYQLSIAFDPTNSKAVQLIDKTKKMKEALHQYQKGSDFLKAQKYFKAHEALKASLALDPQNEETRSALADLNAKNESVKKTRLGIELKDPVSFRFKKTSIMNVFEVLSRLSGVNFIFDKDLADTKVTLFMSDVSFERFLEVLLKTNNLAMKLVSDKTIMIYPDTQAKAKEYDELKIRTFYLANMDAKKAVGLLSKILSSKDIIANEKANAVVIRGGEDVLEIASRMLEANDCPPSEVLLNLEILEVSRTKEKQLGLEINPTSVTFGMGKGATEVNNDTKLAGYASIYALSHSTNKELMLSLPTATLHLLKQDGDTQVLANPQLRVRNSEKATIHIGERVPLRTNRRLDATGNITYDYQYQDVGVKVDAEPTINMHGEISLKLSLEISALGANIGTADDPQYSIRTRTAKSVLSIRDGEPVIIGGLISDEERETIRKIPMIGEVPIVGRLFRNEGRNTVSTDVIMSITPIIMQGQEIPGKEVTQIWSGNETHFSIQEPYESMRKQQIEAGFAVAEEDEDRSGFVEGGSIVEEAMNADTHDTEETGQNRSAVDAQGQENTTTIEEGHNTAPEESMAMDEDVRVKAGADEEREPPNPAEKPPDLGRTSDTAVLDEYEWPETVPYSIHVNSFPNKKYALMRIQELIQLKYECFMVYVRVEGKGNYYRVFVGRFVDYPSARQVCQEYKMRKEFTKDIHAVNRSWAFKE